VSRSGPSRDEKIFVVCPANVATGGPELLHQLVRELRGIGCLASVVYHPFGETSEINPVYAKYKVPVEINIEDKPENLVIFPEVYARSVGCVEHARRAIWWLSVDNYFGFPQDTVFDDPAFRAVSVLYRRRLRQLRGLDHFAQSHYAVNFLAGHGIKAEPLSDYLGSEHLGDSALDASRNDYIFFNPKKGYATTSRLIASFPSLQFMPLQNLPPHLVAKLLRTAKLYIDFGHHPGKDRPPREAAIAGCCVITGKSGAANNSVDMPIPEEYQLDPHSADFLQKFSELAGDILSNFPLHQARFAPWRKQIRLEREAFRSQVAALFNDYVVPATIRSTVGTEG